MDTNFDILTFWDAYGIAEDIRLAIEENLKINPSSVISAFHPIRFVKQFDIHKDGRSCTSSFVKDMSNSTFTDLNITVVTCLTLWHWNTVRSWMATD